MGPKTDGGTSAGRDRSLRSRVRHLAGARGSRHHRPGGGPARPYLLGGVGMYNGKTSLDGLGSSESQTKFGLNAGAGFDFGLGKANLFADARFHAILKGGVDSTTLEETTSYMIPITLGLRF